MSSSPEAFAEDPPRAAPGETEVLHLSFPAWEGPLDLLLQLARAHKVDLAAIPIVELVDQYVLFIQRQRALRLEVAADYLVMAAWLAYLKSLLLLPREEGETPDADALAEALRWRLQRLEAMRGAAERLASRPRIGRDVLLRGRPEGLRQVRSSRFEAELTGLLLAYGDIASRRERAAWVPGRTPVISLEDALLRLSSLIGTALDWTEIAAFLPPADEPMLRRSAVASGLVAALELARQGALDLAQEGPFAPLFVRRRPPPPAGAG
ncbi:MAG: segregation and condensation protein A [Thermaurantiacus sp.]